MEENKDISNVVAITDENKNSDVSLAIPSKEEIITRLDTVQTQQELDELTQMFNFNLVKKDMARASTQSDLLDLIVKEVGDRVKNRSGELTNKDLLDYMNAMQANIDKTQKAVRGVDNTQPIIKVINNTNKLNINVNDNQMTRESREHITNAVKNILAQISAQKEDTSIKDASDSVIMIDKEN